MVIKGLLALALFSTSVVSQGPLELGGRRELFVDDLLVERLSGARFELGSVRDEGPVFHFDRPWEGPFCGYATVIHDGDRYLLYYRGLPRAGADGTALERTCVAVSADGRRWRRPRLGHFKVEGAKTNNVVLADAAPVTHNFSPFLDVRPGTPPSQRFKALGGNEHSGLVALCSADGFKWTRMQEEPVFRDGVFDSQNVAFWSAHEGRYLCYFRTWTGGGYRGFRTISRTTSTDFVSWTDPVEMSFGDTPKEHLYTNQTHAYFRAPHLYVAVAARFMPGRQVVSPDEAKRLKVNPRYFSDCSDAVLLTSRGGGEYTRRFMEGFIRPGVGLNNWVSRSNYPALNVVQTGPAEMSLYVNQDYAQPTAHLRRYSMRLDGFAAVSAPYEGGEVLTKPLRFSGQRLMLNFATSAAGGVRVEIQDRAGQPVPGFTLGDSVPLIGNEIERAVRWKGGDDLEGLQGKVVRLRLVMNDARVFALRFAP